MKKIIESPIIYELMGLPGSGKTYLSRKLSYRSRIMPKYNAISKVLSKNEVNNKLKFFLIFHSFLGKSIRLYDAWAYEVLKNNSELHKNLILYLKPYYDFIIREARDSKDLLLLSKSIERDFIFNQKVHEHNLSIVNDDGLLQRLVSIFGLRNNDWKQRLAEDFQIRTITSLPSNLVVIFTESTPEVAMKRMSNRRTGFPEMLDKDKLYESLIRSNKYLDFLYEKLVENNVKVIKVDSRNLDLNNIEALIRSK